MKRSYYIVTFAMSIIPTTNVYADVNISCYSDTEAGTAADTVTCIGFEQYQSVHSSYENGATITCTCYDDPNLIMKYTCDSKYQAENTELGIEGIDYAQWIEGSCYEASEEGSTDQQQSEPCAAGYFKNDGVCYSCAEITGEEEATSATGSDSIMDCFLPTGRYENEIGSYKLMSNCFIDSGLASELFPNYS